MLMKIVLIKMQLKQLRKSVQEESKGKRDCHRKCWGMDKPFEFDDLAFRNDVYGEEKSRLQNSKEQGGGYYQIFSHIVQSLLFAYSLRIKIT